MRQLRFSNLEIPRFNLVLPLAALLGAAGCFNQPTGEDSGDSGIDSGGETGGDNGGDTDPTWYNAIQPIVMENCAGCHFTGSTLSYLPFDSYEATKSFGAFMLAKISGDTDAPYNMPPFPPIDEEEGCEIPAPIKDDPRLTAEEIALFRAWVDAGAPEGDAATAVEFTQQPPPILEGPGVVSYPGVNHIVPAARIDPDTNELDIDHTKCFSVNLDPDNPVRLDAIAVEADPANPGYVHHVIIGTDPTGVSYTGADGGDPNDGQFHWCETDNIPNTLLLYTFTPGGFPLYFPENSAYELPAGARLTFTVHYHRGSVDTVDNTTMKLRFTEEEPEFLSYMDRFGAASYRQDDWSYQVRGADGGWDEENAETFPFYLEAGDSDYHMVWKEDNDLPQDYRLWSVFPHMHYAGKSIRISLDHNDGTETCLGHIDPWDFNWQLTYVYDKPYDELPMFYAPGGEKPGDTVVIDCRYDNTMENDRLRDAYLDNGYEEPIDLAVGEDGFDEMCVMHYGLLIPWDQR